MLRRAAAARPFHKRQPHTHHHDVLPLLNVPRRFNHQLPAKPQPPLRPVHNQQPPLVVRAAPVRHLAVRVRRRQLLRHNHRNPVHLRQLPVQQRRLRPQLVQRPKLINPQRLDVSPHIGNVRQFRRAHAVLPQQPPRFVEHIRVGPGGMIVPLPRVIHQRQMRQPVKTHQPVRLARRGRADRGPVGVDVVRRGRIRIQQHVVNHLHRVPHQRAPHFPRHGNDRILIQRQRPGHLRHQLVRRHRLPPRGQRRLRAGRVLHPRIPGHIPQLQGNLKGIGGHIHPREQVGDVRIQVDVRPQRRRFPGGHQLLAAARAGAVHRRLQIRLPVLQNPGIGLPRLPLLRRQHAAHARQIQGIHPPVLAERHPRPVAPAPTTAVVRQQGPPLAHALLLRELAHRPAQPHDFLLHRRNVRVHTLAVKLPRLRHLVLDRFHFPGRKSHQTFCSFPLLFFSLCQCRMTPTSVSRNSSLQEPAPPGIPETAVPAEFALLLRHQIGCAGNRSARPAAPPTWPSLRRQIDRAGDHGARPAVPATGR